MVDYRNTQLSRDAKAIFAEFDTREKEKVRMKGHKIKRIAKELEPKKYKPRKAPARKYTCEYCAKTFALEKGTLRKVCSSSYCKNAERKFHRHDIYDPAMVEKTLYYIAFPLPPEVDSFEYVALWRSAFKRALRKDYGSVKAANVVAVREVRKHIASLSHDDLMKKLLLLEREYLREVELKRLRINIRNILGTKGTGGDYTLAEVGKVLGVSRERTRQIEDIIVKQLRHPTTGRSLKQYLELRVASDE